MAAVTICSDIGAQKIKPDTVSTVSPSFSHEVMGPDAMILVFWMLSFQLCPILCDPMDCRPPGSSVHGILQARILEWVAIPFSRGYSQPRDQTRIACIGGWILYWWATWEVHYFTLIICRYSLLVTHTHVISCTMVLDSQGVQTLFPLTTFWLLIWEEVGIFHSVGL